MRVRVCVCVCVCVGVCVCVRVCVCVCLCLAVLPSLLHAVAQWSCCSFFVLLSRFELCQSYRIPRQAPHLRWDKVKVCIVLLVRSWRSVALPVECARARLRQCFGFRRLRDRSAVRCRGTYHCTKGKPIYHASMVLFLSLNISPFMYVRTRVPPCCVHSKEELDARAIKEQLIGTVVVVPAAVYAATFCMAGMDVCE